MLSANRMASTPKPKCAPQVIREVRFAQQTTGAVTTMVDEAVTQDQTYSFLKQKAKGAGRGGSISADAAMKKAKAYVRKARDASLSYAGVWRSLYVPPFLMPTDA